MEGQATAGPSKANEPPTLTPGVVIDLAGYQIWLGDVRVLLNQTDHELLAGLLERAGQVVSYDELLRRVGCLSLRALNVRVHRLRRKLSLGHADVSIETVRGVGYRFAIQSPERRAIS